MVFQISGFCDEKSFEIFSRGCGMFQKNSPMTHKFLKIPFLTKKTKKRRQLASKQKTRPGDKKSPTSH